MVPRYVKVAFFRGMSPRPVRPRASKGKDTRYIDIHEGDELPGFLGPRLESRVNHFVNSA